MRSALLEGARYPARSPDVNIADIKAQVAANERGVQELARVVHQFGWDTVKAYMRHVMDNAEESVRRVIGRIGDGAFDYVMDDGAPLRVAVTVDRAARTATVDFTGTGSQHRGNFNAPPAVTRAVVLYVFRCLVGEDIPLNDGCLKPLTLRIPQGTFLSPAPGAAGVAGVSVLLAQGPAGPTFNQDVAPILFANCVSCHRPGEVAPMSLLTFESARPWASAIIHGYQEKRKASAKNTINSCRGMPSLHFAR